MFINGYFPVDKHSAVMDNNSEQELIETQQVIEQIIDSVEHDDILIGADLNWDPKRTTGFSENMKRWTMKLGLVSVWE